MRAGRKILSVQHHDIWVHVGQLFRHDEITNGVVAITPRDIEEIDRIFRILRLHLQRALANIRRYFRRMQHFFKRRA